MYRSAHFTHLHEALDWMNSNTDRYSFQVVSDDTGFRVIYWERPACPFCAASCAETLRNVG